jgi:hypothetical protein
MLFAADGTPEMWTPSQRELVRGAIEALHVVVGIMDVKMVGSDAAMILDELSQLGTPEALVARRRCGSARKALGVDGTKSGPARKRPATRMHRGREPGNNVEALFARLVAEGGLSLKQEGMADSQKVLYHLLMPFDTRVDELTPRQMSAIKAGVSAVFALGAFREIVALKEVRRPLFDPARVQTPEAAAKVQDALSTLRRVQRDLGIPLGYTRVDGDLQALRGDSRDRCKVADAVFVTGEGVYAAGESRPDQLGAAYAFAQRNDAALRILFCPPGGFAGEPDSWTLEERDKIREATVALADYFDNGNIPHHGGQFLGLTRAGAEKVVDAIADAQFANRWAVVGQGISDEALANLGRIASCQYLRQG